MPISVLGSYLIWVGTHCASCEPAGAARDRRERRRREAEEHQDELLSLLHLADMWQLRDLKRLVEHEVSADGLDLLSFSPSILVLILLLTTHVFRDS